VLHLLGALVAAGTRVCWSPARSRVPRWRRARRLRIPVDDVGFAPGRDLDVVLDAARPAPGGAGGGLHPDPPRPAGRAMPGGPRSVCAPTRSSARQAEGITVLLTGHVTKHGDRRGRGPSSTPSTSSWRSGRCPLGPRVLSSGKNRFGAEGETAWFEMGAHGLARIDPTAMLVPGESAPGSPSRSSRPAAGRWRSRSGSRRLGGRRRQAPGHRARSAPVPAGRGGARPCDSAAARPGLPLRSLLRRYQGR
jgi:hypothetical protein